MIRILESNWTRVIPGHSTKNDSLICYLALMTNFMKKNKDINWFFPETLLNKESRNLQWTGGTPGQTQTKAVVSDATFPSWTIPCKQNQYLNWFFPGILIIKESCSLIGWGHIWTHTTKSGSLTCCLSLLTNSIKNN